MSYIQLAKINNDADFIAATSSMGWNETNYQEVLQDLKGVDGFIPNLDITKNKKKLGKVMVVKGTVYGTIGDKLGDKFINRWYELEAVHQILKDENGKFWAKGKEVWEM